MPTTAEGYSRHLTSPYNILLYLIARARALKRPGGNARRDTQYITREQCGTTHVISRKSHRRSVQTTAFKMQTSSPLRRRQDEKTTEIIFRLRTNSSNGLISARERRYLLFIIVTILFSFSNNIRFTYYVNSGHGYAELGILFCFSHVYIVLEQKRRARTQFVHYGIKTFDK